MCRCFLQALAAAKRLTFVSLASNMWTCNCSLRRPAVGGSEALTTAWDLIVCQLPPAERGRLLSSVLGRNSSVVCDGGRLPPATELPPSSPFDLVRRRWMMLLVVVAAVSVALLVAVLVYGMVVSVRRRRCSKTWAPCREVDSVGSSGGTSRSDVDDSTTGDVIKAGAADVTTSCDGVHAPSVV